jgi:GGDEF domain-containing protein
VYFAAIGIGVYRIFTGINERRSIAQGEFYTLADTALSTGALGFMEEPFKEAVRDAVLGSETLLGVIISGPYGAEFAFERENSDVISWLGNSPRFQRRFGISRDPYFAPLQVAGLRNVTITAVSNNIDYPGFTEILKQSLILVLAAMVLSAATLMINAMVKGKQPLPAKGEKTYTSDDETELSMMETEATPEFSETATSKKRQGTQVPREAVPAGTAPQEAPEPRGLYSDRSVLGWEPYTQDRLTSELRRSSDSDQDLTLIIMEMSTAGAGIADDASVYRKFADRALQFFKDRSLLFEKGPRGISVILPNTNLKQGFAKAEEFHKLLVKELPELFPHTNDLRIGLSSRSERRLEADRLLLEATKALERTQQEESSIVAFKSDPEKYRAWQEKSKLKP